MASSLRTVETPARAESLTIVIPALDEEEAIGGTIQRCLDAREELLASGGVSAIELIVVSDGSTDRTVEIARSFDDVSVIVFPVNRGYGAAIKEGWRQGGGSLLAFLDADGTCDPRMFGPLCNAAVEKSADVVLGSRMGPDSKMPPIRRLGNRIYAFLLGLLSGRKVTDTASGMRVVRRSALASLEPLPDGLHFTPSMSARALMNSLRVVEIPMPYEERIGRSKLSVFKDGVRFLRSILSAVLYYRPESVFLAGFGLCAVCSALMLAHPIEFYLQNSRLEEWMLYRFIACFLLGVTGYFLLLATSLINAAAEFSRRRAETITFWASLTAGILSPRVLLASIPAFLFTALLLLWPGIVEYGSTRTVTLHWSRVLSGGFLLLSSVLSAVFALLITIVRIWRAEQGGDKAS